MNSHLVHHFSLFVSFPHLFRSIERLPKRTLSSAAPSCLLPAHSENIFQTRKSQPAKHLFLIRSAQSVHLLDTFFSFIITIYGKEIHTAISSTRKNRRYSLLISGATVQLRLNFEKKIHCFFRQKICIDCSPTESIMIEIRK